MALAQVSYGYRRLHVFLQREGWEANHKRVYRLYSQEGLILRNKKPKQHDSSRKREERQWLRRSSRPEERSPVARADRLVVAAVVGVVLDQRYARTAAGRKPA